MRKKLLIAIVALFMLGIFAGLASAQGNGRTDVKDEANQHHGKIKHSIEYTDMNHEWSREAVMEVSAMGFVKGDNNHRFNPNQPLTHLEAIVALLNAKGFQDEVEAYNLETSLSDWDLKKIPDWGKQYVAYALERGIITADELKTFNPNQGVKRYEICLYLARISGETVNIPQTKKEFKDLQVIPEAFKEYVRDMHKIGLVNGDPDGNFAPNRVVKRCEMAVILGNLEDNVLHRFADTKVKGTLVTVTAPDSELAYAFTVNNGDKEVVVVADKNTVVFVDGHKIENLDELVSIAAGSHMRLLINEDKAVLVRISTATDVENDNVDELDNDANQVDVEVAD